MYDTGPDQEGNHRVETLLKFTALGFTGLGGQEGVPNEDKDDQTKRDDVHVGPQIDLVSAETSTHLMKIMSNKVESTKEDHKFKHNVVEDEHGLSECIELFVFTFRENSKTLQNHHVKEEESCEYEVWQEH